MNRWSPSRKTEVSPREARGGSSVPSTSRCPPALPATIGATVRKSSSTTRARSPAPSRAAPPFRSNTPPALATLGALHERAVVLDRDRARPSHHGVDLGAKLEKERAIDLT